MDEKLKVLLESLVQGTRDMSEDDMKEGINGMDGHVLQMKYRMLQEIAESLTDRDNRKYMSHTINFCTMILSEYAIRLLMEGRSKEEVGKNIGGLLTMVDKKVTEDALGYLTLTAGVKEKLGIKEEER